MDIIEYQKKYNRKEYDKLWGKHRKFNMEVMNFLFDRAEANVRLFNMPYYWLDFIENHNDKDSMYKWYFITINYKINVSLEDVQRYINQLTSYKWVEKYIYNYEWRETATVSAASRACVGLHNHILIAVKKTCKFPAKPCHIKISMTRKTKTKINLTSICDTFNRNILNIKRLPSQMEVQRKLLYFKGIKKKSKIIKVNNDERIRKGYHLAKYYKKNIII